MAVFTSVLFGQPVLGPTKAALAGEIARNENKKRKMVIEKLIKVGFMNK